MTPTLDNITPPGQLPLFFPGSPRKPSRRRVSHAARGREEPQAPLVLIVDDMEDNREMYAQFLAFAGYRVETAEDGFRALEKVAALRPDVVVMDLALPGMDGWETTRRIKEDERTRAIPVIALTGHAVRESRTRALEVGCDGFLTKPCLPDELAAEVRRALAERHH